LRELLDHLDPCGERAIRGLDDETGKRDDARRLGGRDADDVPARVGEPDGQGATDCAGAEDCRSVAHAFAGSTTRFTTLRSEYTSSDSIPASRQPVPESFTPPNPMCGSEPCVPAFTTTTPACTRSANRIARWTLAV